jgi:signal transduction histidine kinase
LELETERTDMARELHDIIGHTLNVMLVHAGAARRALPGNVVQAEEAIQIIETTGRSAMDDLDRVLGLLRSAGDGPPRSPLPGIDDLRELATSVSDAGLQVTVDVSVASASIPKPVQLTLYRIAQEALTNVMKHTRASAASVSVTRNGADLVLDVCDNGQGIGSEARPGRGLTGMKQRAEMHGGTMSTSAHPDGGTVLSARIPMTA